MHLLAAEPVADVAHEERADRAGDVRDAEGRERGDRGGGVVALGEEDVGEDQRGGGAVDREVVVLQRAAEPGGERRLARRTPLVVARSAWSVIVCPPVRVTARRVVVVERRSGRRSHGKRLPKFATLCHAACPMPVRTAAAAPPSPTSPRRPASPPRRCPGRSPTRTGSTTAPASTCSRSPSELGYAPNPAARALESGRTNTLALLVPDITNPYFSGVIKGAERAAAAAGLTLVLGDTQENPATEEQLVRRLGPAVDGFVLSASRLPDDDAAPGRRR